MKYGYLYNTVVFKNYTMFIHMNIYIYKFHIVIHAKWDSKQYLIESMTKVLRVLNMFRGMGIKKLHPCIIVIVSSIIYNNRL